MDSGDWLAKIVAKYVVAPFIVVIGMYMVGAVLDTAMETHGIFTKIFAASGGVGIIGFYFYKFWRGDDARDIDASWGSSRTKMTKIPAGTPPNTALQQQILTWLRARDEETGKLASLSDLVQLLNLQRKKVRPVCDFLEGLGLVTTTHSMGGDEDPSYMITAMGKAWLHARERGAQ